MNELTEFLKTSYTAYQAVENAVRFLRERGFCPLKETETWKIAAGGKYYVVRGGSALIAFTAGKGNGFKIVASHTDSPCFKLKENPVVTTEGFRKLNVEPYGGGIWYTFFDRPLKLAGRVVRERNGALVPENFVSPFDVVIPSLAVHMQRDVNEKFAPNLQTELPLLTLTEKDLCEELGQPVSFDLYAVPAETPFESGMGGEFLSSPRVDNLTSVFGSLQALSASEGEGLCVAACLDSEEVGSRTRRGACGDFLKTVLRRIYVALGAEQTLESEAPRSFMISLDNAHSLHPNHADKCDPTNRAVLGGGIVIKGHAGGAYTTEALSSAVVKTIFRRAGVKFQTFYNRSDMRSGSTLGACSLGQFSVMSADLGIAQLAMHSAVETFAKSDYSELKKGLKAFYESKLDIDEDRVALL